MPPTTGPSAAGMRIDPVLNAALPPPLTIAAVGGSSDSPSMTKCQKVKYRDRIAALLAMAITQRQDKSYRAKVEGRAYYCADCRGWHLTSQKRWRAA